jgi:hypothetical protein
MICMLISVSWSRQARTTLYELQRPDVWRGGLVVDCDLHLVPDLFADAASRQISGLNAYDSATVVRKSKKPSSKTGLSA